MDAAEQAGVSKEQKKSKSYMSLGAEAAALAGGLPPEGIGGLPEDEASSVLTELQPIDADGTSPPEGIPPKAGGEPEPEDEAVRIEPQAMDAATVSGLGEWQIGGKGKFFAAELSLNGFQLTVTSVESKHKRAGEVLASGSVRDCTVSKPKNDRKGHPHALRIDLAEPESTNQQSKFLLSVSDKGELMKWTAVLVERSHAAAEVQRMKEKGPDFLSTILPTVDINEIRHKIWRAYLASLETKEEKQAADDDLRRGTHLKANTAAKRVCHARLEAAVRLAQVTQLVHVPVADQLPMLEQFVLTSCFMREGTSPNGKWCELQFAAAAPPVWGPVPAGAGRVRLQVSREIAKSERSYVNALQMLVSQYLKPMRAGSVKVSDADLRTIFGDVEVIKNFGEAILEKFEDTVGTWDSEQSLLGPTFLEFAAYLKVYAGYINGFNDAIDCVGRLEQTSPPFAAFLEEQRDVTDGHGLADFLIQPIQRVPRYRMLLEELLKHTPEDHADHPKCVGALDQIKHIATELNEAKRTAELKLITMNRLRQLNAVDLMEPHRSIVTDGMLECEIPLPGGSFAENMDDMSAAASHIFLFTDILIHAVYFTPPSRWKQEHGSKAGPPKEVQRLMPMHRMLLDCESTTIQDGASLPVSKELSKKRAAEWAETLARSFTISDGRGHSWRMFAASVELKNQWIAAIRGTVSELGAEIVENLAGGSERKLTRLKTTADTKRE